MVFAFLRQNDTSKLSKILGGRVRCNLILSARYYFSVAAKQYLEDVSASRRWLFNLPLWRKKEAANKEASSGWRGDGPREKAGKKEGKPHTRAATVSSTSPREIIDSQRGNDVVNTTSEVPEPSGLYSPTSPSTRRHLLVLLLA